MTDISELRIVITGDDSDAAAKLAALRQNLTESASAMAQTGSAGQQASAGEQAVATGAEQATGSVRALQAQVEGLRGRLTELNQLRVTLGPDAAAQLTGPIKETEAEIAKLEAQMQAIGPTTQAQTRQMAQSFMATVSTVDELRAHLLALQEMQARGAAQGIFTPGLQAEISRTDSALQSLTGTTNGFEVAIGRTTERMLTHVLVYAAIYEGIRTVVSGWQSGIDAAAGYQAALLRVDALTVSGAADTKVYSQAILEMSQRFPATAKELGDALFFIESHGIKGAAAMDLLTASAQANEAGLGKTSDVARIAAGAVEAYGAQNLSAARAVDILTAGVKEGSLAPETLANSLGKVVGIAAHMGISFEEVIANIATLTRQAVPAAQATTDLSSVMLGLDRPSAQAKKALADLHMTAADLSNEIRNNGLMATLTDLEARTGGNTEQIEALLPNVHALRDMFGVTGNQAQAYAESLAHAKEAAGGTTTAAETMSQTFENQQKILKNNWDALIIGLDLMPKMAGALSLVTEQIQGQQQAWQNLLNSGFMEFLRHTPTGIVLGQGQNPGPLSRAQYYAQFGLQEDGKTPLPARDPSLGAGGLTGSSGPPAPPSFAGFNVDALRDQQKLIDSLGTEGAKLHETMVAIAGVVPGSPDQQSALNSYFADLTQVEQAIRRTYDPANPQKMADELGQLKGLTDAYSVAVDDYSKSSSEADRQRVIALQQQIDLFDQEFTRQTRSSEQDKKDAEYQRSQDAGRRQAEAERQRQARAAYEADPLAGIRESLQKDRTDLVGTAGTVMADLQNAVVLRGQQGARAAGEAFGTEARKWGEEMEKAGVPGWQDAFNHLIALGEVAVVTGSPQVVGAIRQMLAEGEATIRQANIDKAMGEAVTKSTLAVQEAQNKFNDAMASAAASAADAQLSAVQAETDREYDAWASHQVEMLSLADQQGRELQRIHEKWDEEDRDRAEQHARALTNLQTQQNRAQADQAQQQARAMADLQLGQTRSAEDTSRSRVRESADAEYEHQKRLAEIGKTGGADVGARLADENEKYRQSIADTARKRQEDDAESAVKRQEQIADATRKQYEASADAARRAAEARADLAQRESEQEADTGKTRQRQIDDRTRQNDDSIWLRDQRLAHESQFHIDAQSKAQQRYVDDLLRIDTKYQHEVDAASAAQAQIQAKAAHDETLAGIQAQVEYGAITAEEGVSQSNAENTRFTQETAGIQSALRDQQTAVDAILRDAIAATRPAGAPVPTFAPAPTLAFPELSFPAASTAAAPGTGIGSGTPINITINVVPGTPVETQRGVRRGVLEALASAGVRAGAAGALPSTG